jgi:pimeloyl-ACP methyl ester carboxylesterase
MAKKLARIFFRTIVVAFVLLVILLLVFDRFVQFRMDDAEVKQFFAGKKVPVSIAYYHTHEREIRYLRTGSDTSATLLFIHGAPSSSSYFKDYLSDSLLLQQATMYAVDRPGYGYSGLAKPVTSLEQQAACIRPVLDSLHRVHHPVILVAASYGTSIACRLAMDYPRLVDGLVLIAPALAPGEERIFWFTPLIENPLFHWFIPRMFQSANAEKLAHRAELASMLPFWSKIKVPVVYLQGANDGLVYTSNALFARSHLVNAPSLDIQMIPGKGHLIAFSEKEKIRNSILGLLSRVKNKENNGNTETAVLGIKKK